MKMLAWEAPFTRSISGIRQKEVAFSGRMAQIRGLNLSLQFCMTPVVAFVTFSVYIAMGNKVSSPRVFQLTSILSSVR
jgi:ATP-binding cassette subfamily C (CFTR/MRP) protein 4